MRLRETLLGLAVLALLAGGVWWARGRGLAGPSGAGGGAAQPPASAAPDEPDVTLADAAVELGVARIVLSVASRPVVAFARSRFRVRAESGGAPVALEGGRISFEMSMPMGDHRYRLVPGPQGWQEAEVVLPLCASGERRWYATVEGTLAGEPRKARFRLDLTPPASAPPS